MPDNNGWNEWSRHVLAELHRLNDCIEAIPKSFNLKVDYINLALKRIEIDIAKLQVKSGVWGAIGGMIPVVIMLLVMWYKSHN